MNIFRGHSRSWVSSFVLKSIFFWLRTFKSPAEWLMLGAFAIFSFVYPFAILLMSFDWMPFGMEWMSSLLLVLLGLSCLGWLWANYSLRGILLSIVLFALGVCLEYIGVQSGFPFGAYRYTGVLVPELPGGVPLAIGFAWLLIVISGSYVASRFILSNRKSAWSIAVMALLGGVFAVGLDLLLEPVAYHVKGYWQWLGGDGGYYGIPWSNFAAWFVAAALFIVPLAALYSAHKPKTSTWLPVALYIMNVIMFGIVNIAHGFWWPGLVGVLLLVAVRAGGTFGAGRKDFPKMLLPWHKGAK